MGDIIVWADIPVKDMQRAMEFYGHVTGRRILPMPGSEETVVFISGPAGSSERIVSADLYVGGTPSHDGPTIYLGANGDIDAMVARVPEAGGRVLQEKQFMGDMVGWIAFVEDSEGNRIGIQQPGE